jgi:radical SAM protein with 4Fe4S-binding SPASM domain
VFASQARPRASVSWPAILERIRGTAERLRITGGECTLHPDFPEILQAADRLAIPFVVFTNGNWDHPDATIRAFARNDHLEGLLVSLHGHDGPSHRAYVQCDTFERVTGSIRGAVEAGVRVTTNTVLLRSNVDHLEEIVERSLALGASAAAFSRYYGRTLPDLELAPDELYAALERIARLRRSEPRVLLNNCVPLCFAAGLDLPTRGCTSGFTHCTIDPWGDARPCTHSPFGLGSVLQRDIVEIWSDAPLRRWRDLVPDLCRGCGAFGQCRGGCRATAYQRGVPQDPLIRAPIEGAQSARIQVSLFRHLCPVPDYTVRRDSFGAYLINRSHQVAVSDKALPILQAIDGKTSLAQIQAQFGQAALDFIGTLMLGGLVK